MSCLVLRTILNERPGALHQTSRNITKGDKCHINIIFVILGDKCHINVIFVLVLCTRLHVIYDLVLRTSIALGGRARGPFDFGRYWTIRTSQRRAIRPIWPQTLRSLRLRCANWGQVRTSFAIRGKTCGPKGRRPTFCWGPSTRSANSRCGANFTNSPVGARSASTNLWELAARAQTCGSSRREHKSFRKFQVSLPQISTCK